MSENQNRASTHLPVAASAPPGARPKTSLPAVQSAGVPGGLGFLPSSLADVERLAAIVAQSGFFEGSNTPPKAQIKIMAGLEMGLSPMEAMQELAIVKGKISVSAHLIAKKIKASGVYDFEIVTSTHELCSLKWFKHGREVGESRFTIDQARTAGLLSNPTWKSYPDAMLFNRALTNGWRKFCPEVIGLGVYTEDELEEGAPRARGRVKVETVEAEAQEIPKQDSNAPADTTEKEDPSSTGESSAAGSTEEAVTVQATDAFADDESWAQVQQVGRKKGWLLVDLYKQATKMFGAFPDGNVRKNISLSQLDALLEHVDTHKPGEG